MKTILVFGMILTFASCENCYTCRKGGGFQGGVSSAGETYDVCMEDGETEAEFRRRLQQEVNNRRYDACVKKGTTPLMRSDLDED